MLIQLVTLGKDAELKNHDGKPYCVFSAVYNHGYGNNETAVWIDCSFWGERATKLSPYLTKGKQIVIHGEVKPRAYLKNGEPVGSLQVRVDNLDLCRGGESSGQAGQQQATQQQYQQTQQQAPQPSQQQPPNAMDGLDSDIPF